VIAANENRSLEHKQATRPTGSTAVNGLEAGGKGEVGDRWPVTSVSEREKTKSTRGKDASLGRMEQENSGKSKFVMYGGFRGENEVGPKMKRTKLGNGEHPVKWILGDIIGEGGRGMG